MSRVIMEDSNVTIYKAPSSDNLFKPYMEIWSSYFEDFAAACSFENGFLTTFLAFLFGFLLNISVTSSNGLI